MTVPVKYIADQNQSSSTMLLNIRGSCKTPHIRLNYCCKKRVGRRHCWQNVGYRDTHWTPGMNTTQRAGLLQRWSAIQEELIPGLGQEVEGLTPKLEKLIHTLEWARIEEFVPVWHGIGRPPKDRSALANGFVAKAVLGLTTTVALIDRLTVDAPCGASAASRAGRSCRTKPPSPAPLPSLPRAAWPSACIKP